MTRFCQMTSMYLELAVPSLILALGTHVPFEDNHMVSMYGQLMHCLTDDVYGQFPDVCHRSKLSVELKEEKWTKEFCRKWVYDQFITSGDPEPGGCGDLSPNFFTICFYYTIFLNLSRLKRWNTIKN